MPTPTSLEPRLPDPNGITFLVRALRGFGRTAFALGLARLTPKRILVIGRDRGIASITNLPVRRIEYRPIHDVSSIDAALAELEDHRVDFGGVVVDTLTDWWTAEKRKRHVFDDAIGPRGWKVIKDEHECRLRILQSLGLPVVLLADQRPIWEWAADRGATVVGDREDTEKTDACLADVRLRFFRKAGRRCIEVLKDRTGRFAMGAVVKDPALEAWIPSAFTTAPTRKGPRKPANHAA